MKILMNLALKKISSNTCINNSCTGFGSPCHNNRGIGNNTKVHFKNSCKNLMVCVPEKKGYGAKIIEK